MPTPRKRLVCPEVTPYYHCINRCVRRAFLCGIDPNTGKDLSHRKARIEELMFKFAQAFALDICAYAVMSNHYHLVVKMAVHEAKKWSAREVIERWHLIFKGNAISQRFLEDDVLDDVEIKALEKHIACWRARLADLSWYMRVLNERIAREANAEDECTGRFWQGRYESQALLDNKAVLGGMIYVDLNPIRAGIAQTPETSLYTSIKKRLDAEVKGQVQPEYLLPFNGSTALDGLPFDRIAYFKLIDWTSRKIQAGKASVTQSEPELLERLGIDEHNWMTMAEHFESRFKGLIGGVNKLRAACKQFKYRYCTGISTCEELLGT